MKYLINSLCLVAALGVVLPVQATDPELCLDCHEPAEDWEGMTPAEILAEAKNLKIKRHADNKDLSDDELAAMIAELLKK